MKDGWQSFRDGFVGAFVLAGAIVMAVVNVASAFVRGEPLSRRGDDSAVTHR